MSGRPIFYGKGFCVHDLNPPVLRTTPPLKRRTKNKKNKNIYYQAIDNRPYTINTNKRLSAFYFQLSAKLFLDVESKYDINDQHTKVVQIVLVYSAKNVFQKKIIQKQNHR